MKKLISSEFSEIQEIGTEIEPEGRMRELFDVQITRTEKWINPEFSEKNDKLDLWRFLENLMGVTELS